MTQTSLPTSSIVAEIWPSDIITGFVSVNWLRPLRCEQWRRNMIRRLVYEKYQEGL